MTPRDCRKKALPPDAVGTGRLLAAIAVLLMATAFLGARPAGAAFPDLGAGARGPGMGNAVAAVADDVYALHYNPAGLALMGRPELATSYSRLFWGLSDGSNLGSSFVGYAHPLPGRRGTTAAAWQQFSLDSSLYQEHTFSMSYGAKVADALGPGNLYAGLTAKYLRRAFGSFPESDNAFALSGNGNRATGRADPVLTGRRSAGAFDADLGLLYRFRARYAAALALTHLPQPDVAFSRSDTDRLPLGARLGMAYQSILSNISAQYETVQAPSGTRDHRFTIGLERWAPKLLLGDFGLRGALSVGSRDHKTATAGLSFRTGMLGVDYGFAMPISGVASTAGTHRLSLSIRFGPMKAQDEAVELVLEAMRALRQGRTPEFKARPGQGLSPAQRVLLDEHLAFARSFQSQARYQAALERLTQAVAVSPGDPDLLRLYGRLSFVAAYVKELANYRTDPVHGALHQAVAAYLAGDDLQAVVKASHALSLNPDHEGLNGFLSALELATGLKRQTIVRVGAERFTVETILTRAAAAMEEGRYKDAVELSEHVINKEPENIQAWENLGTSYFALKDYTHALVAWRMAYAAEKSPSRRSLIQGYIKTIEVLLQKPKPVVARPAPPPPAPPKPEAPRLSAEEVQRLYDQGIDLFTARKLDEARAIFERILQSEPGHVAASKALLRVNQELGAR